MAPLFEFWAKSGREGEPPMHSVPHHSLDVAACAFVLAQAYRSPVEVGAATLAALIALHDIGKFTRPFQFKVRELWPAALGAKVAPPPGFHDEDGYALLCGKLAPEIDPVFMGWQHRPRRALLRAVTGHHGRPPREPKDAEFHSGKACEVCLGAARAFIREMLLVLDPSPLPRLDAGLQDRLAWFLAGLAVLADWLGSGQWFVPVAAAEHTDLARYWHEIALPRARRAAHDAHLLPSAVSPESGFGRLFPGLLPRPLQRWAETVAIPDGPVLYTVEDATGSGKTEAALVLAHRLMAAGRADGLFFALPTMATANAMYARLREAYRRFFAPGATPSLVLSHGRRDVHEGFTGSILETTGDTRKGSREPSDEPAEAQCAAWIGDDRRKAFLAEIGAGTIDQAVMAVLPTRHAPLRLLGLSRRVLIVDEAHAYDSYVNQELYGLLRFQAALGGSAIVLSATLTAEQRGKLQAAFLDGLGALDRRNEASAYPLTTTVSRAGIVAEPCAMAPELARRVAVERIDRPQAVAAIVEAARAGASVAWIRNAVDDAIAAADELRSHGLDPVLFHARFAMGDRQNIETEVLARFGRESDPTQRKGQVVVGTQVLQESLDLDLDLIVTDLAPADLVIQRAGRLWRHRRGDRPIPGPRLLLLSPEPIDDPPADWLGPELRRTGRVYPDHALLWRSARALLGHGGIDTPDGIRALVEAAYDDESDGAIPPGLSNTAMKAKGKNLGAGAAGYQNVLKLDPPYRRDADAWEPDIRTPTRLAEARLVFRLAKEENGAVLPWYSHSEPRRSWALSEVSLRQDQLKGAEEGPALRKLKEGWSSWEQEMPVLLLRLNQAGEWHGTGTDSQDRRRVVTYDAARGLLFRASTAPHPRG